LKIKLEWEKFGRGFSGYDAAIMGSWTVKPACHLVAFINRIIAPFLANIY